MKITVTEFEGKPLTAEQKDKAAAYILSPSPRPLGQRDTKVVPSGYGDVAEVRTAITDIYKSGSQLGLTGGRFHRGQCLRLSGRRGHEDRAGPGAAGFPWWDGERARGIIDSWSARMAEAIVMAHTNAK